MNTSPVTSSVHSPLTMTIWSKHLHAYQWCRIFGLVHLFYEASLGCTCAWSMLLFGINSLLCNQVCTNEESFIICISQLLPDCPHVNNMTLSSMVMVCQLLTVFGVTSACTKNKTRHLGCFEKKTKVNTAESNAGAGPINRSAGSHRFVSTQDAQRQLEDGPCDRLSPLMRQDAEASVLTSLPRRSMLAGGSRPQQPGNVDDASEKQENKQVGTEVQGTRRFGGIKHDGIQFRLAHRSVSASSVTPAAHLQALSLKEAIAAAAAFLCFYHPLDVLTWLNQQSCQRSLSLW